MSDTQREEPSTSKKSLWSSLLGHPLVIVIAIALTVGGIVLLFVQPSGDASAKDSKIKAQQAPKATKTLRVSEFAGIWTSGDFTITIKRNGTGTFEAASFFTRCPERVVSKCMGKNVPREYTGTVKLMPTTGKTAGQMLVRLTTTWQADKPRSSSITSLKGGVYVLNRSSDNRFLTMIGNETGHVIYSGCNEALAKKSELFYGCR